MNRRTFVASAGVGLTATVAGCLSSAGDPAAGSDPSDDGGDGETDDGAKGDETTFTVALEGDSLEDVGEFATLEVELIDSHVERESTAALEATLSNAIEGSIEASSGAPWPFGVLRAASIEGGEPITLWTDAYEDSHHVETDGKRVRAVAEIGLVEEVDAEETVSRTYELDEETPSLEAGTYETTIGCSVWPAGDTESHERLEVDLALVVEDGGSEPDDGDRGVDDPVVPEDPRVDEPPYDIEEPEHPEHPEPGEEDDWNDQYLGEHMPSEPSLEFERLRGVRLAEPLLSLTDEDGGQYAVSLIETESERDGALDLQRADEGDRDRLETLDFDRRIVVVVEAGFGSSSIVPRWKRVESVADGVHLHGYYTKPQLQMADYSPRRSVLLVDRPDDGTLELARVSLTVDADARIHFNSTEGAVTPEGRSDTEDE